MGVLKGPEGICQATRFPAKIYPFCMCQQPAEPDEWYCAEHLEERRIEREKLLEAGRRTAKNLQHIDGTGRA